MTWAAVIWLVIVIADLWIALILVTPGTSWHRPLPEMIALVPAVSWVLLLGVTVCAIVGAALGKQQWWMALVQIVVTAVMAAFGIIRLDIVPRDYSSTPRTDNVPQSPIHVMTLNCRYGHADPTQIVRTVRRNHVDVLALQEVTKDLLEGLKLAGIADELPFNCTAHASTRDNGGVNALFSRVQPLSTQTRSIDLHSSDVPTATFTVGDHAHQRHIMFASAHIYSPQRGARSWGQGIADLARFPGFARTHNAADIVVMGDLNANVSHPTFRLMLLGATLEQSSHDRADTQMDNSPYALHSSDTHQHSAAVSPIVPVMDSSLEARAHGPMMTRSGKPGNFAARLRRGPATFPVHWHILPPVLELDHILHTPGLRCTRLRALTIAGSDHAALIAELHPVSARAGSVRTAPSSHA
jgi:endonuclease/exonuclease/phosphatase family metal-dependent hydrolase